MMPHSIKLRLDKAQVNLGLGTGSERSNNRLPSRVMIRKGKFQAPEAVFFGESFRGGGEYSSYNSRNQVVTTRKKGN
jgi:hypothetical protein